MGSMVSYGLYQSSAYRLPPLEGEISLPCLENKGSIKYDKWGIPHIYASSRKDAYRLQGFVTAQHRCFQLTMAWLALNGKLCSVIGAAAKPVDVFARTCNFKGLGEADWEWLFERRAKYQKAIDAVSCYAQGINAWLSHPRFYVPVELSRVILNYSPQFWSAADVMAMGRYLGIKMSPGWSTKMMATLMIQIVGRENAKWFCYVQNM